MRSAEPRARRWLRLDAVYCAGAGLLAIVLAAPLGRLFHVPALLVAAIGVATLAWALILARLAALPRWRHPLRLVAAANAVASLAVMALAVVAPAAAGHLLLAAVAVEVGAFAAVQLRLSRE